MAGFFSRFAPRSSVKHLVAIDLGSNTAVRSLLFDYDKNEKNCVAIKKHYFELPVREDNASIITPISEHLRRLIFEYIKQVGRVPDQTLIGLGSHFTFNDVITERKIRKRPRESISPAELQAMMNDFLDKNRTRLFNSVPYALVHLMPFRIMVDGYRIDVLSEKTRGQIVEISLFATYAQDSYWETLWRLKSLWGGLELGFVSNQDAIASALVAAAGVYEALILKIGAKITEASILGEGVILFTGQIGIGGDAFTQAVMKKLGLARNEAERVKQQWGSVTLPEKAEQLASQAMRATAEVWLNELIALLKRQERFVLPEKVYLLGGGARLKAIHEVITEKPWYNELTFYKNLEVRKLEAEDFSSAIFRNVAPPLSGPEEVSLAALAVRLASGGRIPRRKNVETGFDGADYGGKFITRNLPPIPQPQHDSIALK